MTITNGHHSDVIKVQRKILRYLLLRGRLTSQGSSSTQELLSLASAAERANAQCIGEIGFNIGLSSAAFLTTGAEVISFDLSPRACTKSAKKIIDKTFPGRHTLIYGDSRETVPEFAAQHPDLRFDLVFIDGGHDYEVAKADIVNMHPLCTDKTVVIMDDLMPWKAWGKGPTQAWQEALREGIACQDALIQDGHPIGEAGPPGKRVWALGHYLAEKP